MKWFIRIPLVLIGFLILFWSLISAGLEKLKLDIRENKLRTVPIEYIKEIGNGEKIKKIYKVPESNVEPSDFGYSFKKIRDHLWIFMSRSPKEKAEVYLLMADKRMFETMDLIRNKKSDYLVFKTLSDSIYNLMEAKKSLFEENKKDIEFFKIDQQINQAGLAYEDIIKSLDYKNEKIGKIVDEIKIWNQKNKEYRQEN